VRAVHGTMGSMRSIAARIVVAVALAAVALLAVSDSLSGPASWSPDGLFYQARVYEIRDGMSQPEALREAFQGPLGARLRATDPDRSGSPQWVAYNARFYERRIAVPYVASLVVPLSGDRAVLDVSLAGYVVAVLAIFWLLLLLRFRLVVAAGVTLATIFLPALTFHSGFPLTDSWGLALEVIAFGTAILALQRGPRWLIAWAAAIALLSITRDSMWIPVLGAVLLALVKRTRPTMALAATGFVAALPAVIAVKVPLRELLAQMLNGLQPAPELGWGEIASRYPAAIVDLLQADGGFVRDGAWYTAAYLLVGLGLLLVAWRSGRRGDATLLMIGGALAGVAYIITVPVFSAFRLELVLVPMAAFGLATAAEAMAERAAIFDRLARPSRKSGPVRPAAFADLRSDV
jgi:hypothetical protein